MHEIKKISCRDGETFTIGGMEFIKFPGKDGQTPVMMKEIAFNSRFGDDNDLRTSTVLKRMQEDILPRIIEAIGAEKLCTIRTDLTTLDGLKHYGVMESKISLVTLDFYRANVEIFDKFKPDDWWWLATPESAQPHDKPWWTLCVSPSGCIYIGNCGSDFGVRPFCIFDSSIFDSFEE